MSNKIGTQENIFKQARLTSFSDIINAFCSLQPGKSNKIICQFHEDKNPGFHVCEDGDKCYGCLFKVDGAMLIKILAILLTSWLKALTKPSLNSGIL